MGAENAEHADAGSRKSRFAELGVSLSLSLSLVVLAI